MKTKIILTLIIAILFVSIYAQGTPGLFFSFVPMTGNTEYQVSRGSATDAHIEIPPTHNGLPVTRIPLAGFMGLSTMESITIPSTVNFIGNEAFRNCTALTTITINSISLNHFQWTSSVFSGCSNLTTVTFGDEATMIPNSFLFNVHSITNFT
jgi:hypothetical protein